MKNTVLMQAPRLLMYTLISEQFKGQSSKKTFLEKIPIEQIFHNDYQSFDHRFHTLTV